MSCGTSHGSPRYALMYTSKSGGMGYIRPTHGTLAFVGASSYDRPSYFTDPSAPTALEFLRNRQPVYGRTYDKASYKGIQAPRDYNPLLEARVVPVDLVQHGNMEYFESLNNRVEDYSLRHQERAAKQNIRDLAQGYLKVVSAEAFLKQFPYNKMIGDEDPTVNHSIEKSSVDDQRALLEELLMKEVSLN